MTSDESILITGGCGFIGHHLALEMKRQGKTVTVLDDFRFELRYPVYRRFIEARLARLASAGIPNIRGDAADPEIISEALDRARPGRIVHMAAMVSAVLCDRDPKSCYETNLNTTQSVLEAVREREGLTQFVFFSTSMVYGHFKGEHVTEDSPTHPIGVYGAAKLAGEHMVRAYHNIFGVPYTIVRPSALYGPTCVNRRVAQVFIEDAILGRPLILDGGGEDRLDFTHVDDVVAGLALVLTEPAALNETFNLTFGESRPIKDLVAILRSRFPNLEIERRPWRETVPHRGTLDITKARRKLGYSPRIPIESGYPRYIEWYTEIGFAEAMARAANGALDGTEFSKPI
jgi:nucleoside-diphosphate-sugar epimerase